MRIKQDLSIALVLAVIGSGLYSPAFARDEGGEALARVEAAIAEHRLSADEAAKVRALIDEARRLQGDGDEDGAAVAMAAALALLDAG